MSGLFLIVLNRSLTASYVILFVILIRLLLKKAPKVISYALWGVVAFRLIIPFSFESIFSLMPRNTNPVPIPHDIIYQKSPQINSGIEVVDSFVSQSLPAPTIGVSVNPLQIHVEIGSYIWILGIIVLLVYGLVSILLLKRQLKSAELIEKNIYEAKNLKTPFVLGLMKPRIYLPDGLSIEEKDYILLHEQTHIHRKDHIIKILAFLILSIHWFNPLVWIAFMLMNTDMELSCDERVLKRMNKDVKRPYANSLLSLATGRHILNGSPLAFCEGNVRGRIKNVLNYRKPSFWVILLSIIITVVISFGLLANPKKQETILPAENPISYEIARLVKGDSQYLLSPLSGDSTGLAEEILMDSMIRSTLYQGIDIKGLEECYLLRATYNDDTVLDYYTFVYEGKSVLQRGENGYFTFINDELYEKLLEFVSNQQDASNEPRNYDKISAYLKEECINVFSPYYELLDFIISEYQEEVVNGNVEAIFYYKVIEKNYDKDPDTVRYIREAKERGDKNYQQLYDEYLQPREMNFYFKAVIDKNEQITLYRKNPAIDSIWEEVKISNYVIKKNPNESDSMDDLQISTIELEQLNTLEGISLVHVKYDSDNSEIKFILQNKTKHNIYFGEEVILEKKQKDEWYLVPYSGEIGFTAILNYLSPSEESERSLPINTWIPITDGEYRIIKEVSLQEDLKNLHYISTDFTIAK